MMGGSAGGEGKSDKLDCMGKGDSRTRKGKVAKGTNGALRSASRWQLLFAEGDGMVSKHYFAQMLAGNVRPKKNKRRDGRPPVSEKSQPLAPPL